MSQSGARWIRDFQKHRHREAKNDYSQRDVSHAPGARFNHDDYRDKHMPLVKARMGGSCRYYTVDKGPAGGTPGAPATCVGMRHIFCDSVESFQAGFGAHAQEIMGDIPNYTDLAPVIQISEVVVCQESGPEQKSPAAERWQGR